VVVFFRKYLIGLFLTAVFLLFGTNLSYSFDITVKGSASSPQYEIAKKEAAFNARKALMSENSKIILTWTSKYYSDVDYNFEKVARMVSLKASAVISKEKVRKRKGIYTVTVYLKYGVKSRQITSELLESFERNLYRDDKSIIKYDHDKAYRELYDIVKRW
jgi:hypothetical protein